MFIILSLSFTSPIKLPQGIVTRLTKEFLLGNVCGVVTWHEEDNATRALIITRKMELRLKYFLHFPFETEKKWWQL